MSVGSQELERVTVAAYNEFYALHPDLFKKDPLEYWAQAIRYKEQKLRDYKIVNGYYAVAKPVRRG